MGKQKIAFDVDGVLGDFLGQYSRFHSEIHPDNPMDFRTISDYGIPAANGVLWSLPGFYKDMPVMEGAKETVQELAESCELHCITATPAFGKKEREDWLMEQFPQIEYSRIHFVNACDKRVFCLDQKIDLLVEDCPETCLSFRPEEIYVFRWEYNRHLQELGYHVGRFHGLKRFLG